VSWRASGGSRELPERTKSILLQDGPLALESQGRTVIAAHQQEKSTQRDLRAACSLWSHLLSRASKEQFCLLSTFR